MKWTELYAGMIVIPMVKIPKRMYGYLEYRKGTYPAESRKELNLSVKLIKLEIKSHEKIALKFDTAGSELPQGMRHGIYEVVFTWKDGIETLESKKLPETMFEDTEVPNALLMKLGLK